MKIGATIRQAVTEAPIGRLRVTVEAGPDQGKTVISEKETLSVGTASGNDLLLTDETVSRYHLELIRSGDRVQVTDHASTNGTVVGAVRIERGYVGRGTVLQLGRTLLRVEDAETVAVPLYQDTDFFGIRGRSREMRRLMAQLEKVAQSDASVLLLGETGTGKELIAKAIHDASPRHKKPFEVVDCGALVPALVASELFGHERGAFTGANDRHVGAFERAQGGTIFLDEIGELPPALQTQLLGVLERRQFRTVGGSKLIPVDVRVVCATHRDLRKWVNSGEFRADLYYRIGVAKIDIPALRERSDDIPLLVEHFLERLAPNQNSAQIIPPPVMEQLKGYHWPGNVRELRNFVESALAFGEVPSFDPDQTEPSAAASFLSVPVHKLWLMGYTEARDRVMNDFQRAYLEALLGRAGTNMSQAAREAQMNRTHLLELLKRHNLSNKGKL